VNAYAQYSTAQLRTAIFRSSGWVVGWFLGLAAYYYQAAMRCGVWADGC
jgi:hypothetical protein